MMPVTLLNTFLGESRYLNMELLKMHKIIIKIKKIIGLKMIFEEKLLKNEIIMQML